MSPVFRCPTCAASLSPNARSCGRCGTRREGGAWLTPESADGIGIDDDTFDYDDFLRREFGSDSSGANWFSRMTPKERFWWVVAVMTLAAFVALAFGR